MKPLCIYHGNCADGFTSAWIVNNYFHGRVDFFPGVYQRPPPDVRGRDVIMVDFSYKKPVLLQMQRDANYILVLDHHESAMKDLVRDEENRIYNGDLDKNILNWDIFVDNLCDNEPGDIYTVFDMARSGAGITWDFFRPRELRPALVEHVEDRDLWRFLLPETREIQAAVFSYPYDFEVWGGLANRVEDQNARAMLVREGEAIERKHFKDIDELTEVMTIKMLIDGHVVPMANLPYTMAADAGHHLYTGTDYPFAGCFFFKPTGVQFSLRSPKGGINVAEIAKKYGGGGHPNASGFEISLEQFQSSFMGRTQ